MQKLNKILVFIRRQPRWRQLVALVLMVLLAWWGLRRGTGAGPQVPTFAARRGPLEINVLEGGSLSALESQEVKCEVRVGYQGTKILKIVEEGYLVTEDDVKNKKELVELDSSELQKQIAQQELQYQQAVASLIDAQQNYEIQLNQNQSDIKAAEQKVRFARMDLDKFLGDTVTARIVKEYGLDKILADASTNNVTSTTRAQEAGATAEVAPPSVLENGATAMATEKDTTSQTVHTQAITGVVKLPAATNLSAAGMVAGNHPGATNATSDLELDAGDSPAGSFATPIIDFSKYANIEVLGDGEAKQKLRSFQDDLQAAQKELGQAKATFEGTQRLFAKQFVARTELVRDQLTQDSAELKVKTAETAGALYLKYDFPKTAEQSLTAFTDTIRELDTSRRMAISKLAQARARLRSAQGQYEVQNRQRNDLNEQLGKCSILAEKTGLVVYGGGRDDDYGNGEPIREGATVRERQAIITIPDMTHMSVKVKIHESYIKKIQKGLKARITVDAFPETVLDGEISKVGVLPDSQNRWMNPDMKVYVTTVTINGTYDWVKPGMSAKVEILVNKLDDVVYIPVQAVTPDDGKQICYVAGGFKPERRAIEVGEFSDDFIQIKSGLKEGERVLLRLPEGLETGGADNGNSPADQKPAGPAKSSAPTMPAKLASPTGKA